MKRIVFLIIASLLVIGLVLPSMVAAAPIEIQVLIAAPATDVTGVHMWNAANMANDAIGTMTHGSDEYVFKLIKVDDDEIAAPTSAGDKLAVALTDTGAKVVIGGFRTEAVKTMVPVACDNEALFFITGAATYSLLALPDYNTAVNYSAGGKYLFRGTPFNDIFLINSAFQMLAMVTAAVKVAGVATPKVAIFAEDLSWTVAQVAIASKLMPVLGATLGPVKMVSDTATSGDVIPALNAIKTAGCHVIFTLMSGPVGTVFSTQKGALDVPAIAVGINVPCQAGDFWDTSLGNCAYEITMATWAKGLSQTSKTAAFLTKFEADYGVFPIYTASSHDVLKGLAAAVEAVGFDPNNLDPVIQWYENPANAQENTSGTAAYYPKWNYPTYAKWVPMTGDAYLPALNFTQYDALYATLGYNTPAGTNFTMPPFSTHDLVYGPGYLTAIAAQWQPVEAG